MLRIGLEKRFVFEATVWTARPAFVQVTVVPAATVREPGKKSKSMMLTELSAAVGAGGGGAGGGGGGGAGCGAPGVGGGAVPVTVTVPVISGWIAQV